MTSPLPPRVLDWVPRFDERSRGFRALEAGVAPRSYTWACETHLDQGRQGSCVGHGWAHEVAAKPMPLPADSALAFDIYREAQQVDEWDGNSYEGTSVLAGAKVTRAKGYLREYRWAFGLQDALSAISRSGPAVIGVEWWSGMFKPGADGFIRKTGVVEGGHCVLVRGVSVTKRTVLLRNSWSSSWGRNGDALLTWDDFGALLADGGECCIPSVRTAPPGV